MTCTENHPEDRKAIQGTIVVVDDNPNNVDLLEEMLIDAGFKVRSAINGQSALASINRVPPDLILLDVQMPGMNGYEVCSQLKKDKKTREIPIIFISALNELTDKLKGFKAGGVDYITKPFQIEEVVMRVNTHLTIGNLQKKLEQQNKDLIEAAKFKEEIEHITRHDLKGPLTPIINYPKQLKKRENLSENGEKKLRVIEEAGLRMLTLINRSLDLFRMEKSKYIFTPMSVDIVEIIGDILDERQPILEKTKLTVSVLLNGNPVNSTDTFKVHGEEFLCYTMLDNLIQNAIEASIKGDRITVKLESRDMETILIHNPAAIPENIRPRFFQKFATEGKKYGTGLGTYSAMMSAKTQNGSISFQTSETEGTTITVHLQKPEIELREPL
ncbi:MAG: hybrid sensor histidine kinase/response regulator [Proteobacteria bacterium]|nr:hybrid sensor histidine kinase/response regulator [Pseudomonadota bacterium]